jgi:hypothetical protein
MTWLILVACLLLLTFSGVLLFGAPYLPTLRKQQKEALDLLSLQPGQLLIELGSGDGRILKEAARRGIVAVGYEINPFLVIYSKISCWPMRKLAETHWRNFWHVSISPADGVYTFLLDRYMPKLDKKIVSEVKKPLKFVSFSFELPGRKPVKKQNGLILYHFNVSSKKTS